MFEQSILPRPKTHRKWAVLLAFAGQFAAVGILIAIRLLYVQPLPVEQLTTTLIAPPPPPPPPPPAPPAAPRLARVIPRHFEPGRVYEPRTIPKTVATIRDLPAAPKVAAGAPGGVPGGVPGGQVGGVLGGILGSTPSTAPPPPPPPPAKVAAAPQPTPAAIRVGGAVEAARLIRAPRPVYPLVAREARVQGTVRFDAVIGKDGRIENLKLVDGSPLLAGAAMNAVKQWVYRPTYLNGNPVRVNTEIEIQFQLSS